MFLEATITLLSVMFMLCAGAVWASCREDPGERRSLSVEEESLSKGQYKKIA